MVLAGFFCAESGCLLMGLLDFFFMSSGRGV